MRILTTGLDGDGRSCLLGVREVAVDPSSLERPDVTRVQETTALPFPPRPPGHAPLLDLGVPPMHCKWDLATFPPDYEAPMHHTDTFDFDTLITGSVVLILDDGDHELEVGDVVVVTGVDHGWRAGPQGATLGVVAQGTMPPDQG